MLQGYASMSSTYDQSLVALSIVIAILASYTALDLAGRVTVADGRSRLAWLIGGAITMGIGIWSMHFVGMLAFSLPMPLTYDVWTVLFSILPAIVASGGALFLVSRRVLIRQQLLVGGVLMGIGIASMHYIGMAAMRMEASTLYDPLLFALSVAIAIGASMVALGIAFHLRAQTSKTGRQIKCLSALVMGAAISGMHYTGMASARFIPTHVAAVAVTHTMQASLTSLAVGIGVVTVVILCFTLLTSFVEEHLVGQAILLKQQEAEVERSQLFTDITLRIRRSLKLEDVLNIAVEEVRQALKIDRVIINRFNPDWSGIIIAESVADGWRKIIGQTVNDPFWDGYIETYKNGRVSATNNIHEMGFKDNHREVLEGFQIKAYIVAPILNDNQLQGLLCGHQCSDYRTWQKPEVELFRQLAIQVGIALEQANLLYELNAAQSVLQMRDRAIAAASNGIVITDPRLADNPIIFCNPAFETITGYSQQETLGHSCRFLQGPQTDPATVEQIRSAVREQRECQVVIKNYRKDGTPFWNQLNVSPVRDASGKVVNFIGVQADITDREAVEEETRLSKKALQHQLVKLLSNVEEASTGNLTVRAEITVGEIGIVADFFNAIIESLKQIVTSVKLAAQEVNISLGENSDAIRKLADEALLQAEEITRALESLDQMVLSIQSVADSAYQAAVMARKASSTAEAGGVAMENTVSSIMNLQSTVAETANKVKRLGKSSQEISKVVSLINEIALQTNVLSINTSIEAAKAGEEGRTFAVVAEEVGRLAVQSAQATREIEQLVENIQYETEEVVSTVELGMTQVIEGSDLVKDAKLSLEQIIDVSRLISELVQSISMATVSQSQTSQAVTSLMKQLAKGSLRTSNSSHQVSGSLEQTIHVAQQLQASVDVFKTDSE